LNQFLIHMQTSPSIVLASRRFDAPRRFPWGDPPDVLTLTHDHVHVWRVALDVHEDVVRQFEHSLAADEQLCRGGAGAAGGGGGGGAENGRSVNRAFVPSMLYLSRCRHGDRPRAIRIRVPRIDMSSPFTDSKAAVEAGIQAAVRLLGFYKRVGPVS